MDEFNCLKYARIKLLENSSLEIGIVLIHGLECHSDENTRLMKKKLTSMVSLVTNPPKILLALMEVVTGGIAIYGRTCID